ncbi:MAG: hypothetical protein ACKOCD_11750 [Nitrospiraceae bacterium]
MRLAQWLILALLVSWGSAAASTGEPVTIGTLLLDPQPFHLQHVIVEGTIKQVEALEPYYLASGSGCYGAYRLLLEDETGALPIAVLGICGTPIIRPPPAAQGDRVRIRGQIHAPGHVGSFYGIDRKPIPGANPDELHAVAAEIIFLQP